jgi:hypothetical protein
MNGAHDLAHVLHVRGPGAGDHVGDEGGEVGVVELRRQVGGQHLALGLLALGLLGAARSGERLGRLPALLRLAAQHGEHLVVGELAGLLARHLLGADGGEHHAEGRRPQFVPGLHGGGEVGTQAVLQVGHAPSLARCPDDRRT